MALGEFGRIEKYFKPLAANSLGALNLADDAAVLPVSGMSGLVVSTDAIVEGVHFLSEDPADLVGRKALRTNLSDLAAMGACPWAYTMTIALGTSAESEPESWLSALTAGLASDQSLYGIGLVGGDSVSTFGPTMLSITVFGKVGENGLLRRSGALPGDDIYVSGTIGDAHLGLRILSGELIGDVNKLEGANFVSRYRLPEPRVSLGIDITECANAAMDISDGLVQDLGHLCRASGVSAVVKFDDVPLASAVKGLLDAGTVSVEDLLAGGDDYELLFSAPVPAREHIARCAKSAGVVVNRIGTCCVGEGVSVLDSAGRVVPMQRAGYRHA